jgi:chitinase
MLSSQWRTYNYYGDSIPIADLPWDSVTHILHVFVGIDSNGDVTPNGLTNTTNKRDALISAAHSHGVKVLLCVGALSGNIPSDVNLYNSVVNNGPWVAATKIMSYVNQYGYDGVALDLETSSGDLTGEFPVWTSLLKNLRLQLVNPKVLTCAATPSPIDANLWGGSEALSYLDRIHLMGFNLMTYSVGRTNHNSTLYGGNAFTDFSSISVDANVQDYLSKGTPANKINIVLPFYGWKLTGYAGPNYGLGLHVPGTSPDLETDYNLIVANYLPTATETFDDIARVPWASKSSTEWYSYDDATSIRAKVDYVRRRNLGGIDAHHIGGQFFPNETNKHPLWQAVVDGYAVAEPSNVSALNVEVDVGSLFRPNGWGQVFSGRIFGDSIPSTITGYIFSPGYPESLQRYIPNIPTTGGVFSVSPATPVPTGNYFFYLFTASNQMLCKHKFTVV